MLSGSFGVSQICAGEVLRQQPFHVREILAAQVSAA
jgi:hypothetical protein